MFKFTEQEYDQLSQDVQRRYKYCDVCGMYIERGKFDEHKCLIKRTVTIDIIVEYLVDNKKPIKSEKEWLNDITNLFINELDYHRDITAVAIESQNHKKDYFFRYRNPT